MARKRKISREILTNPIEYEVSSGNIFSDFAYNNPREANVKSDLALLIHSIIKYKNLTQAGAAQLMGIDQPKVSKIIRGILSEFTIDRLMHCLLGLGCDLEIRPSLGEVKNPSIHVSRSMQHS